MTRRGKKKKTVQWKYIVLVPQQLEHTNQTMYLKFANCNGTRERKVAYLRDQHNFGNQEDCNERRRLSQMISIAAKKHDGNQSLAWTSLQVHYGIFSDSFLQCFKLIATETKKKKKNLNPTTSMRKRMITVHAHAPNNGKGLTKFTF